MPMPNEFISDQNGFCCNVYWFADERTKKKKKKEYRTETEREVRHFARDSDSKIAATITTDKYLKNRPSTE